MEISKEIGSRQSTTDLINAVATNPAHALEAHKEELQKYFNKSPEEGSEKMRAVYFEYLYLNMHLFNRCAFTILGNDRRKKLCNIIGLPIVVAAIEKHFEGVDEDNIKRIYIDINKAEEEYSQCEELIPPGERIFSKKAMTAILSRRIANIFNVSFVLTSITALAGLSLMRDQQYGRESDLAELITKSALECAI
jgi:hypothetical protein